MGTRELDGLKVLMALMKNWDLKSKNNEILAPKKKPGPRIYYVSDLGATFGHTGTFLHSFPLLSKLPATTGSSSGKAKGNPYTFSGESFIKEVRNGRVYFYARRSSMRSKVDGVPVASARWMGSLLGRLSDRQLADAFRAGGFDNAETVLYVSILRTRIIQLQRL